MKLRCQIRGTRCPPYAHEGVFKATDETLTRFESDVNWCAKCTACAPPALPNFQNDLSQIVRITLWQKGPAFDPSHQQKASFRSYILPWVCGALTRSKNREIQQYRKFMPVSRQVGSFQESSEARRNRQEEVLFALPDKQADFIERLIWELWNADFEKALPQLLRSLTKREQQVFSGIRENLKQCDIAEALGLSTARVSQLLKQVERKLKCECQIIGLIE